MTEEHELGQGSKEKSKQFLEQLSVILSVKNRNTIMWFKEREYIGYHVTFLLYSKEEAKQMWDDAIANGGNRVETFDNVEHVGVDAPRETLGDVGTMWSRNLQEQPEKLQSADDIRKAQDRLQSMKVTNFTGAAFVGTGGEHFGGPSMKSLEGLNASPIKRAPSEGELGNGPKFPRHEEANLLNTGIHRKAEMTVQQQGMTLKHEAF